MIKHQKGLELGKQLAQIKEDESDMESDSSENEDNESVSFISEDENLHSRVHKKRKFSILSSSESSGDDRVSNIAHGKKKVRNIPDFETDSELDISTQKASDDTLWVH